MLAGGCKALRTEAGSKHTEQLLRKLIPTWRPRSVKVFKASLPVSQGFALRPAAATAGSRAVH